MEANNEVLAGLQASVDGACAEIDRLRAVNAELVKALEAGLAFWPDEDGENLSEWREQARAALAKAG